MPAARFRKSGFGAAAVCRVLRLRSARLILGAGHGHRERALARGRRCGALVLRVRRALRVGRCTQDGADGEAGNRSARALLLRVRAHSHLITEYKINKKQTKKNTNNKKRKHREPQTVPDDRFHATYSGPNE